MTKERKVIVTIASTGGLAANAALITASWSRAGCLWWSSTTYGPGYRVYLSRQGPVLVLLL